MTTKTTIIGRVTITPYPSERRIDIGWGSARYVRATEYRATNTNNGIQRSFWTKREAVSWAKQCQSS